VWLYVIETRIPAEEAVLSQLRASANWHRIAREWMYGDEPVTELGRAEAEFYGHSGVSTAR